MKHDAEEIYSIELTAQEKELVFDLLCHYRVKQDSIRKMLIDKILDKNFKGLK